MLSTLRPPRPTEAIAEEPAVTGDATEPSPTDSFIGRQQRSAVIIIEVDSTDDPANGQQQLIEYNGFYDQYIYHPL